MQVALRGRSRADTAHALSPWYVSRFVASGAIIAAAFFAAAWLGHTAPFRATPPDPYSQTAVLRAIPFDAPLPYDIELASAGRGMQLPYHIVWTSKLGTDAIGQQVLDHLAGSPKWQLTENGPLAGDFTTHLARISSDGQMTHFAELSVRASATGSIVSLDFTPIPTSLAPR